MAVSHNLLTYRTVPLCTLKHWTLPIHSQSIQDLIDLIAKVTKTRKMEKMEEC
jgi:hypothetical protein